jgi:hypothetical protein
MRMAAKQAKQRAYQREYMRRYRRNHVFIAVKHHKVESFGGAL